MQVKPRKILKNIVLAHFCIDPYTDRPSSCGEEEELDDSGPKSNEGKESDDNNSAITESTAPDSIEVPSVVLPTSDISQSSNTSLTTPTAPDSSVEQSQTIFFIIPDVNMLIFRYEHNIFQNACRQHDYISIRNHTSQYSSRQNI